MRSVTTEQIKSANGAKNVVNVVYKRDKLRVLSDVYYDFNKLISARRRGNEEFKNYEARFGTLLSKFNAHGSSLQLPESITALMLISTYVINDNHRVSILAAASEDISSANTTDGNMNTTSSADMVENVKYEAVVSIL